jgi:CelD/BcsL family acetyltransferase involved in cellulose biosynthesis
MDPQTAGNHFTLQTIRDLGEVENLREVWKTWQRTRDSDLDFFSGMVRSRGDGCRPHVIVLSRNARPDALLVGLTDRTKIPLTLCSVTMRRSEVKVLEFVYGGLLGNTSKENSEALVHAVMRSLAEGDADLALWEQLDVHSALYTCVLQLPSLVLRDHSRCLHDHWFMNFPKDLDAFLSSVGRSQRSKLRRKYKRVLNSFPGKVQVRSFRTIADLEQAIPDMEQIARKSVKRQLGFGFFDTPETREQLFVEAARGWLRLYILYVEEKPVSYWKGTLYACCLQTDHVGFDSAWSAFSPGIFLFLSILQSLRHEDVKTVDLGWGNGQFYQCFGNMRRSEARVQICAPKLKALQLNLLHTLTHYVTTLIRGTPGLNWARRAVWKSRQAALARRCWR